MTAPSVLEAPRGPGSIATLVDLLLAGTPVEGLVRVAGYQSSGRPPAEVLMMEKAAAYEATAVFFEAAAEGGQAAAQAFVFVSDGPANDAAFAELHRRLWSWGGVPIVYRRTPGLIQLFRCRHRADFVDEAGNLICNPVRVLDVAGQIAKAEAYWDAARLRDGSVWDDAASEKLLLAPKDAAHRALIEAVAALYVQLKASRILDVALARRLLILSLLIAYLDERGALEEGYFARFRDGASTFAQVLSDGPALVRLLKDLEGTLNGGVFALPKKQKAALRARPDLSQFSRLIEGFEDETGQTSLWRRYSFRDLPVELISHVYQLFVSNSKNSVYTPPALVRLMLDEALSTERLDRLITNGETILDPACGSGIFLVEAYKRLIVHWRSKNEWAKPTVVVLRDLLEKVRGIDLEHGAVELAAFSLCLALCDELEPEEIRATEQLFPKLIDHTIVTSCFFSRQQRGRIAGSIGVIVGNPPFESKLATSGALRSCALYEKTHGPLPDKQVAYLFLHESMELLAPGGLLCMIQQYNLLYNPGAGAFRTAFMRKWDLREVLDFVSIRNLFDVADTKAVAVVAEAAPAPAGRVILHAVFRRTPKVRADLRFETDYYDLHWIKRSDLLRDESVARWRAGLLGGARVLSVVERLRGMPTLLDHAMRSGWTHGEGFAEGAQGRDRPADHIIGKELLPSTALTGHGINESEITIAEKKPIEAPRSAALFTPPMLLIREQMDLHHAVWTKRYLTYKNQIVGFAATDASPLQSAAEWLGDNKLVLQGFVAANSAKLFTQKATSVSCADIYALPFPDDGQLDLSENERIVLEDVTKHYRDFVRLGFHSSLGAHALQDDLDAFNKVLCDQINTVYSDRALRPLDARRWPGMLCQPYVFGDGQVDWAGDDDLRDRLEALLHERRGESLSMTRILRLYDGAFVFLLKPNRLRYWIKSIALRDGDDLLADLRSQGF